MCIFEYSELLPELTDVTKEQNVCVQPNDLFLFSQELGEEEAEESARSENPVQPLCPCLRSEKDNNVRTSLKSLL